jgi:RimJ/RimL family protein N-acetyltransferase
LDVGSDWQTTLPMLTGRGVLLREAVVQDLGAIVDLLSIGDASRFGLDYPVTELAVHEFIERAQRHRAAGASFTYVVLVNSGRAVAGVMQVRRLDPAFEAAEFEGTLAPSARGTGAFIEAARLIASFAFGPVGAHRLETRVLLQNGRANSALRKLGAVQEGILRRSVRHGGEYVDQVLWSLLKDDWTEQRASAEPRVH